MEIQPLFYSILPVNVINYIYIELYKQKRIYKQLKKEIIFYNSINELLKIYKIFLGYSSDSAIYMLHIDICEVLRKKITIYPKYLKKGLLQLWISLSDEEIIIFLQYYSHLLLSYIEKQV